eukprot:358933-Chlamydomonas_euryale.AAC.2
MRALPGRPPRGRPLGSPAGTCTCASAGAAEGAEVASSPARPAERACARAAAEAAWWKCAASEPPTAAATASASAAPGGGALDDTSCPSSSAPISMPAAADADVAKPPSPVTPLSPPAAAAPLRPCGRDSALSALRASSSASPIWPRSSAASSLPGSSRRTDDSCSICSWYRHTAARSSDSRLEHAPAPAPSPPVQASMRPVGPGWEAAAVAPGDRRPRGTAGRWAAPSATANAPRRPQLGAPRGDGCTGCAATAASENAAACLKQPPRP